MTRVRLYIYTYSLSMIINSWISFPVTVFVEGLFNHSTLTKERWRCTNKPTKKEEEEKDNLRKNKQEES